MVTVKCKITEAKTKDSYKTPFPSWPQKEYSGMWIL